MNYLTHLGKENTLETPPQEDVVKIFPDTAYLSDTKYNSDNDSYNEAPPRGVSPRRDSSPHLDISPVISARNGHRATLNGHTNPKFIPVRPDYRRTSTYERGRTPYHEYHE